MKTLVLFLISIISLAPMETFGSNGNLPNSVYNVPEEETEMFTSDPLAYISSNFHLKDHPVFLRSENPYRFYVTFNSSLGALLAVYDQEGELVASRVRFNNVRVPQPIMMEVYEKFPGWEVKDIKYRASGRGETFKKEKYIITLHKDDKIIRFKRKLES